MSGLFENADTFLNANSDLFTGLSEADLLIPEKLVFIKGEVITGTILDMSIIEKIGAIKVELKIESGDHAGKIHELTVFKPKEKDGKISAQSKKNWVEFLLALYTKEEILAGKIDMQKHIGATLEFKANEAKEYSGKIYQNYSNFKLVVGEEVTAF